MISFSRRYFPVWRVFELSFQFQFATVLNKHRFEVNLKTLLSNLIIRILKLYWPFRPTIFHDAYVKAEMLRKKFSRHPQNSYTFIIFTQPHTRKHHKNAKVKQRMRVEIQLLQKDLQSIGSERIFFIMLVAALLSTSCHIYYLSLKLSIVRWTSTES